MRTHQATRDRDHVVHGRQERSRSVSACEQKLIHAERRRVAAKQTPTWDIVAFQRSLVMTTSAEMEVPLASSAWAVPRRTGTGR